MRTVLNALELFHLLGVAVCIGIRTGVQFDNGRTDIISGLDLRVVGIDKQGHADACIGQDFGELGHFILLRQYVQTAFCGHFLAFFRHDAHIFRHHVERVFQHFFRQRHFQIQARADGVFNGEHVRIFNMAAVFTQVHGNQICAVGFRNQRRFDRAGINRTARIADGGNMVDVYA